MFSVNNLIIRWWRSIDRPIFFSLIILFCFSLILVTTSSASISARIGLDENYFSLRQPIYLLLAVITIIVISSLNIKSIKSIAIIGFLINIILLILVKFFGYEVKGAVRWINILGISIQPSEFIKPLFAVVVAWLLSIKATQKFPAFEISNILYLLIIILLAIQPDFGMIIMITAVYVIQIFAAGMPILWLIAMFMLSLLGLTVAYFYLPHAAMRINSFLDPENNENYQVSKSIQAFKHGGLYGTGPGEGAIKQSLPDSHTDFIFAVAGEEFGAIICVAIIFVFAFIVIRSLYKLILIENHFIQLSVVGIISQFALQSIINICVVLNLLPTKGMTLPFISYGGSSTIAIALGIGITLSLLKSNKYNMEYKLEYIL